MSTKVIPVRPATPTTKAPTLESAGVSEDEIEGEDKVVGNKRIELVGDKYAYIARDEEAIIRAIDVQTMLSYMVQSVRQHAHVYTR